MLIFDIDVLRQEILEASPEQITPAWSLLTYTFLSPIVWLAYKMPHLPYDLLPPLSDFDHLRNLVGHSFPVWVYVYRVHTLHSDSRLRLVS